MEPRTPRPCSSKRSATLRPMWKSTSRLRRRRRRPATRARSRRARPVPSTPCGRRSARATRFSRPRSIVTRNTLRSSSPNRRRSWPRGPITATPRALPAAAPRARRRRRRAARRRAPAATATRTATATREAARTATPTPAAPTAAPRARRMRTWPASAKCCAGSSRRRPRRSETPRASWTRTRSRRTKRRARSRGLPRRARAPAARSRAPGGIRNPTSTMPRSLSKRSRRSLSLEDGAASTGRPTSRR
mmetsp:Transcript_154636/g.495800  ORF Transcript_154636/g.495800 Transcript_154636/m.495800 type:complete len:248 (+) Transcript_154636:435-1178(+)